MMPPAEPVEIQLRRMELRDVAGVHTLDAACFSLPWSETSYRFEVTQNHNSRAWVAETPGSDGTGCLVGLIVVWVIVDEAHIGTLCVDKDFRRRRIAQRLLAQALLDALPAGIELSLLEVRRGNTAAQALYTRFGYHEVGVRPHYYQDNNEDALLLTLDHPQETRLRQLLCEAEENV